MFLAAPPEDRAVQALYDEARSQDGYVANYIKVWAWRPEVRTAYDETRQLVASQTSLSAREIAVLNSTTASRLGDSYCAIAWGSRLAELTDATTAAALLRRDETPELSERERALVSWASAVVEHPSNTTQTDVDALRAAGLSDRDVVDATLLVAFRLAFGTVNDALGARPDRQLAEAAPQAVLSSVTYGRAVDEVPR
jgi:uncharacterized peroxidase-related enzyme